MEYLKKNLNPILFFFCYSCILIFSTIGDFNLFDWDEINFAESSREMLVTNNFSQVMINFEPFHDKLSERYYYMNILNLFPELLKFESSCVCNDGC